MAVRQMNHPGLFVTMIFLCAVTGSTARAMEEDVADQMRKDSQTLTPWSANSATVKRNPEHRCTLGQPFEFLACGPNTTISLALMPGMWGSLEYATTQGGAVGQFLSAVSGMGQSTSATTMDELAAQADSRDGTSITLVIPLIDYGFTGSFRNASISMNRANSQNHQGIYQAIGPADAMPGAEIGFPLSGTVVIEEYSPVVLRGSFSGSMVDASEADLSSDDPVLPVRVNLSGTFNVIAPWRGDSRAVVRPSEDIERAVRQDIRTTFNAPARATAESAAPGPGPTISGMSDTATPGQACECSCNIASSAPPACQQACAGTFEACKGEPVPGISAEQRRSGEQLVERTRDAEVQLREDFILLMENQYGNQANFDEMLRSMLETFDGMNSFNDKATLYTTQGGKKLCPPPESLKQALQMYALMFCQ